MKTLQQQYILIKEGKGNKDHFLKQARHLFPEFITPTNDYNTTVHILKSKSILNETAIGGVITSNPNKPDWFKIFDTNIREAIGVKNTKEYGDQNEFEKIDKNVQDVLDHQFDNKDEKNIDNVYGQSFLIGYYTEMKDPKNADKTVDELKAIVLKNMVKDINYYHTEASFGVKGIGYTSEAPGAGIPKEPKGKFKSSGYGDMPKVVKEGLNEGKLTIPELGQLKIGDKVKYLGKNQNGFENGKEYEVSRKESNSTFQPTITIKNNDGKKLRTSNLSKGVNGFGGTPNAIEKIISDRNIKEDITDDKIAKYEKYTYTLDGKKVIPDDIAFYNNLLGAELDGKIYKIGTPDENGNVELRAAKGKTGMYTESLNEAKKSNVHTRIKDLEKQNEVLALESKIAALDEAINELTQKVSLSESDDLAEMMDPKKINELKKDIKILEKYKMTCEKKLSKLGGKKAVVDNEEITEEITEGVTVLKGGILRRIDPQNEDKSYNVVYDDWSEEIISVSHDDWDKINSIYQKAKNG